MRKEVSKLRFQSKAIIIIALGVVSWSFTMVKSGWMYPFGLGFWGPNGHDGIWHIALTQSLARGSWHMPVFSGSPLENYHIGFDLILALISRLSALPVSFLYFQIIPPVLALLVGILTYRLVLAWKKSRVQALWATFFVYFGGSFGWVITLVKSRELGGESMFWSQQAVSTLINPPFALSLVFILAGFICFLKSKKIPAIIFFGLLIEIKVYAGLLILGGLLVAGLYSLLREKSWKTLTVFGGSAVVSALLFPAFNRSSGSLIVFQPFWFLETMMGSTDRVGWLKFYSAMMTYKGGGIWAKGIPAYLVAFIIFLAGNLGNRLIAVLRLRSLKRFDSVSVTFWTVIAGGIVVPMLFLQTGTPWNTIQFFYYSLVFLGILSGIAVGEILEKKSLTAKLVTAAMIVVLTLPTTLGTLWQVYLPGRPPAKLSHDELSALTFLAAKPDGVVLTYPFDRAAAKAAEANPPRPLYLYESTAYVSAFSNKETYLEDEVNLDITGYDWKARRAGIEKFYREPDERLARKFLTDNGIKYVYWLKGQRAYLGESRLNLKRIFENKEVDIFEFLGK